MDFTYFKSGAVGPLNGTLSRPQARRVLGGGFKEFKKTTAALNTTDAFNLHHLHVYYDVNDVVEGVEFFRGSKFTWKGHSLVGEESSKVLDLFRREGIHPAIDDDGFDVEKLGMSFYVPDIDEVEGAVIETLYVNFRPEE